jgi:hypothetical protein
MSAREQFFFEADQSHRRIPGRSRSRAAVSRAGHLIPCRRPAAHSGTGATQGHGPVRNPRRIEPYERSVGFVTKKLPN